MTAAELIRHYAEVRSRVRPPIPPVNIRPTQIAHERQQRIERMTAIQTERRELSHRRRVMESINLAGPNWVNGKPTLDYIIARICAYTGTSIREIRSDTRGRRIVLIRQCIMYWARRLTDRSSPQIARKLGGRDHTTVLHGISNYPKSRAKMGRTLRRLR